MKKPGFFAPGHKNIFRKKPGFSKCIFTVKKFLSKEIGFLRTILFL
ncbi:Uncharacterized protein dnm_032450 [Desulfonema magnum]|uniref:Uncharacterized protein n=1 Tax=Desulfonema magnum TaxID=45655 RepID=A0A975BKQ2_9BACT|nr:Uncharacterized protein dnm_032450 [Desulfonema magnum]